MSTISDLARGEATTRSYPLFVNASFSYDDFTSGVGLPFCTLPIGARVLGGFCAITTAWDSGTSDSLEIGDATDPNEYLSALDAQSAVTTEFSLSNMFDAAGAITPAIVAATDEILIEITSAGTAATAGVGNAGILYVDVTKADENYE
jgi:hypothetical protein